MPLLKASIKDLRKIKKRTLRNKAVKSQVKTIMKKVRSLPVEEAKKLLPKAYSIIDKAAKKGVIKKGTAARYKSRITKRVSKPAS